MNNEKLPLAERVYNDIRTLVQWAFCLFALIAVVWGMMFLKASNG